jgi:hypothetical protein
LEYLIVELVYKKLTVPEGVVSEATEDDDFYKLSNMRQNRFKEIANAFMPAGCPTIRLSNIIKSS